MTSPWATPETEAVNTVLRRTPDLCENLFDEINSLAHGEALAELTQQAANVVRSRILGGLADLRHDPHTAPAWAQALAHIPGLAERTDWQHLGEALLFEVGTTGGIAGA